MKQVPNHSTLHRDVHIPMNSSTPPPLVSIIVPVFNTKEYLNRCLDSLTQQTLTEIEIICVDNGSTDGSQQLLADYHRSEPRLKVIHAPGGKPGHARNAGLQIARGRYIGFVDSDDFVDLDFFETLVRSALEYDADICIGNMFLYSERTAAVKRYRITDIITHLTQDHRMIIGNFHENPKLIHANSNCNKLFSARLIRKHNILFPEDLIFEDNLFHVMTLYHATKVVITATTSYYYFQRARKTSITANTLVDQLPFDIFIIGAKIQDFLQTAGAFETGSPWRGAFLSYFIQGHYWVFLFQQPPINRQRFFQEIKNTLRTFSDDEIMMSATGDAGNGLLRIKYQPYSFWLYARMAYTPARLRRKAVQGIRAMMARIPGVFWLARKLSSQKK